MHIFANPVINVVKFYVHINLIFSCWVANFMYVASYTYVHIATYIYCIIGASLSEPHHMGSTVKSVFLLACVLVCLLACL